MLYCIKKNIFKEVDNKAKRYGRYQEAFAIQHYVDINDFEVYSEQGYFTTTINSVSPPYVEFTMGYTPDGMVCNSEKNPTGKGLVEVKAPYRDDIREIPLTDEVCFYTTQIFINT